MRKLTALTLSTAMILSLAGCGLKTPEPVTTAAPAAPAATEAPAAGGADAAQTEAPGTVEPEITLVFAEVNPLDTIVGQTDSAFKEKVEELSGGKSKIDIQASGVRGSENDVLDTMLADAGTIDMSRISALR